MKKHNLHTHSTLSDGILTPIELISKAKQEDIEIIGISDHLFAGKISDDWQIAGMPDQIEKIEKYVSDLNDLKIFFSGIEVKIGAEIEADRFSPHPSQLPFEILNEFDYLLFEYVNEENCGGRDISELVNIRAKLKIPIGLAHNDLQNNYNTNEEYIAKTLADNDIFVEICQSEGLRNSRYKDDSDILFDFYKLFSQKLIEELVKNEVKVVIGTDTHSGDAVGDIDEAKKFIKENNLRYHKIID